MSHGFDQTRTLRRPAERSLRSALMIIDVKDVAIFAGMLFAAIFALNAMNAQDEPSTLGHTPPQVEANLGN